MTVHRRVPRAMPAKDKPQRKAKAKGRAGPKSEGDNNLYVASVEKAFRVLDVLNEVGKPLGLSEIVPLTGLGKSATQRFVFTLRTLGYVNQDPLSKAYSLSTKMLEFGRAYLSADAIREKVAPLLAAANRQSEETVNLSVLDRDEVVYVLRYPSRHAVSVDLSVGSRLPAFCTAPGRAILAHLEPSEADRILEGSRREKRTEFTVTGKHALKTILAEVRSRGFCINNQEAFIGDISIASPVFNHMGKVVAAVNIAVPWPRWSVERVEQRLVPVVVETARRASHTLGHQHASLRSSAA
ncbi:MAG TPA: IclR family transcriptional regulator C-terminal domain-containing protein [Alphaproteobacteria bacterium]|nr:IclR family transcriptional regulator C-terminal domain-containing protein [Alphaproteobacteria bacterium]